MANIKISEMASAASVAGADVFPILQGGLNKKASLTVLQTLLGAGFQPLDSELTAIAALTTTSYGRAFLELANAAAARTALALGTAATSNTGDFDAAGAAAAAQAASQPIDLDLTAIAALTTTSFGRGFLALADAAAARTLTGSVIGTNVQAYNANLDTFAGIAPSANVQSFLAAADYAQMRTALEVPHYIGAYTWANLLAVSSPQVGWTALVTNLEGGMWHYYNGTRWMPSKGYYTFYKGCGSLASPLATMTGITSAAFSIPGGNPEVLAGQLGAGSIFRAEIAVQRRGANGTASLGVYFGTSGSPGSNSNLGAVTLSATDGGDTRNWQDAYFSSATAYTVSGSASIIGTATTSVFADRTTNINTAASMFASILIGASVAANVADSFDLISAHLIGFP